MSSVYWGWIEMEIFDESFAPYSHLRKEISISVTIVLFVCRESSLFVSTRVSNGAPSNKERNLMIKRTKIKPLAQALRPHIEDPVQTTPNP